MGADPPDATAEPLGFVLRNPAPRIVARVDNHAERRYRQDQ